MNIDRRKFIIGIPITLWFAESLSSLTVSGEGKMFGLIGKMIAAEGKRDELIEILLEGTNEMPGCLSYIVAKDSKDSNAIWITEVWKDEKSHKDSLSLPTVKQAIAKGRLMIAGFGDQTIIEPVGGQGFKM